ncbi:dihydrofolate reductase [Cronobacter phage vB_CsaM_GAP32]|uniref:dihydrofolate reductase n=1 Tax=Cronobacter phage vB_CsaM_GAP32 TaxID=1141136 RepID=K4F6Y4_9CAUD|nr:dihydrofolate reductase [Cronobacter phage vB_CsaM_GAP32]AFC21758.1 dihydrofolate reductase [Cronobacter phage vB_CsaM_GAP32]
MNKMILCTDSKHGIGKDGSIPWHSTEDFKHFKEETVGKKVLMGYKTWESLPRKPLPERLNIVVTTRNVSDDIINQHKDVIFIHKNSLSDFLRYNDNIVVIGGSTIYHAALPFVDEVILSQIDGDFECDTFFDIHSSVPTFIPKSTKQLADGIVVTYFAKAETIFSSDCVRWI